MKIYETLGEGSTPRITNMLSTFLILGNSMIFSPTLSASCGREVHFNSGRIQSQQSVLNVISLSIVAQIFDDNGINFTYY